jgi:anti-anti-sigma factor
MATPPIDGLLEIAQAGPATVIKFHSELLWEEDLVRAVGEKLNQVLAVQGTRPLILDFSKVSHISSRMVARLISVRLRVESAGGRLALCGISAELFSSVFELTGLNKIFRIHRDSAEAIQSFL